MAEIDFGFNRLSTNDPVSPEDDEKKTDLNTGNEDNKDDTTNIANDDANKSTEEKVENGDDKKDNKEENDNKNDDSLELVTGTKIEIGNDTYTVDDKGNLIDNDGKIFKETSKPSTKLISTAMSNAGFLQSKKNISDNAGNTEQTRIYEDCIINPNWKKQLLKK